MRKGTIASLILASPGSHCDTHLTIVGNSVVTSGSFVVIVVGVVVVVVVVVDVDVVIVEVSLSLCGL